MAHSHDSSYEEGFVTDLGHDNHNKGLIESSIDNLPDQTACNIHNVYYIVHRTGNYKMILRILLKAV